ncbi:hypothetical protein RQP46_003427 [Phenoliferia psychrophenolica]
MDADSPTPKFDTHVMVHFLSHDAAATDPSLALILLSTEILTYSEIRTLYDDVDPDNFGEPPSMDPTRYLGIAKVLFMTVDSLDSTVATRHPLLCLVSRIIVRNDFTLSMKVWRDPEWAETLRRALELSNVDLHRGTGTSSKREVFRNRHVMGIS